MLKMNQALLNKLQDATRQLLANGPAAATAAIQQALAGQDSAAPEPRPMRDLNPAPAPATGRASADGTATAHDHRAAADARRPTGAGDAGDSANSTNTSGTSGTSGTASTAGASGAAPGPAAGARMAEALAAMRARRSGGTTPEQPREHDADKQPGWPGMAGIAGQPDLSHFPGLSQLRGLADLPELSNLRGLADLPDLSNLRGLVDLPELSNLRGLGDLPDLSNLPGLADLPDLSNLPGQRKARKPAPLPPGAQFLEGVYQGATGTRDYKLYIPSSYHGQPMPLLVMLHGCTQDPDDFAAGTRMNALAEEQGMLVVYPAQSRQANQQRCWNWFNALDQQRGQGEPAIIAGIAQQVAARHAVAPGQVYVAGMSAGGAMAVIVGTLYPDVFAAVGVHSGLPFASARDLPSALQAMKQGAPAGQAAHAARHDGARPIIVFHGDRDSTVHPRNGEQVMSQQLHHHPGAEARHDRGSVPQGRRYTRTTHRHPDGTPLGEHWVVHGAGHAWSGGSADGSYTDTRGPDASREMLRFFRTVGAT